MDLTGKAQSCKSIRKDRSRFCCHPHRGESSASKRRHQHDSVGMILAVTNVHEQPELSDPAAVDYPDPTVDNTPGCGSLSRCRLTPETISTKHRHRPETIPATPAHLFDTPQTATPARRAQPPYTNGAVLQPRRTS